MISLVSDFKSSPMNNIKVVQKNNNILTSGLRQDKFEMKNCPNVVFGKRFSIPVEAMEKEGEQALEKMLKLKTIDEKVEHFENYLDFLKKINTVDAKSSISLDEVFYKDFTHELTGSFVSDHRLEISTTKSRKAINKAFAKVINHVNKTSKMYQYFIDNNMDSPNSTIGAEKVFGLVMDAFADKANARKTKIKIKNKHLLEKYSQSTTDDYKNYIIMSNLLGNAIKYSPQKSTINIGFAVKDNGLHFVIKDKGIGILSSEHQSVQNGKRGSNVGIVSGSGYGLSRIKSILKSAKIGELKITSPLHPTSEQKGTKMECNLISDCSRTKQRNFFERLLGL